MPRPVGVLDRWAAAPVRVRVVVAAVAWFVVVAVPVGLQNLTRTVQAGDPIFLAAGPIGRLEFLAYGGGGFVAPVLASVLAAALAGRLLPALAAVTPPLVVVSAWSLVGAAVGGLSPLPVLGGVAIAGLCSLVAAALAGAAAGVDVLRPAVVAVGLRVPLLAAVAALSAPLVFVDDPISVFRLVNWGFVVAEGALLAGLLALVVVRHAVPWLRVGLAVAATLLVGPLVTISFQLLGRLISTLTDSETGFPVAVSTLLQSNFAIGRLLALVVGTAVGVGLGLIRRDTLRRTPQVPPAGSWPPAGPGAGKRV